MKKLFALLALLTSALLSAQNPPPNQALPIIKTSSFSAVGTSDWIATGPGVTVNSLSWTSNSSAPLAGCQVQLEGSPDQVHVSSTLLIAPQDCGATPSSDTVTGISANYVRIHVVGLASGSVGVTYTGTVTGTISAGGGSPGGSVSWGEILGVLSDQTDLAVALAAKAPLFSPTFAGVPTTPMPPTNDNSLTVVNSAWVRAQGYGSGGSSVWGSITGTLSNQTDLQNAINLLAPLASPAFTGNPTALTQTTGNSSTRLATTAFVQAQISTSAPGLAPVQSVSGKTGAVVLVESDVANLVADLALKATVNSPAFTGNPTAPTPLTGDNSTALATTQFVKNQGYLTSSSVNVNNSSVSNPNFNNTLPAAEAGFINCRFQFTGGSVSHECPFGTGAATFAVGNDSRITGAEQTANKNAVNGYAGLDASSKLNGAQQAYGTLANTAAQGNDSRIVNAVPNTRNVNTVNSLAGGGDLTQDRTFQLVNDTAAPGVNKYYGTNGSGVRGWLDFTTSSGIGSINALNANAQFITFTGDTNLNAAENSAGATHVFTVSLVGTIPKARLGTAVFTDQANTWTTGLQDFTNATLQVPSSSGASPTINARIAYDTASNTYKGGTNGFTQQFAMAGGANDIAFTTAFQVVGLHLNPTPSLCAGGTSARGIDANGNGTGCFTPSGSGNVTGPGSAVDNNLTAFNGISGTIVKDSGIATANVVTESAAAAGSGFLVQSAGANKVVSTTSIVATSVPTACTNSDATLQCAIAANAINLTWGPTPIPAGHLNSNVVQSFTNDPNITFVVSAQNATVALVGTIPKARLGTTVFTDQANTYSAGAQDFTSAASLLIPASAGASPTASKSIAYDTTSNTYEGGVNGVNHTFAFLDSNITGNAATATALAANPTDCSANQYATTIAANGNLTCAQVTYAQVSGTPTLAYQLVGSGGTSQTARNRLNFIQGANFTLTVADNPGTGSTDVTLASTAGGLTNPMVNPFDMIRAGAAGVPTNLPGVTTYDGVPQMLVEVSTAGAASTLGWAPSGVPVTALSSASPTILYTHRANLITTTNNTTATSTGIAAAGSSQFDQGFTLVTCNTGTVLNTITPTTSTVNTNTTLKLQPGYSAASGNNPECAFLWSDNTNYWASVILPTDSNGRLQANGVPAFTGDVTNTAGSLATTVGKVNGGSIPANAGLVGTNVGGQLIAVTVVPTSAIPAFTGDVTNSAGSLAMTLASTAVTPGSYTYSGFTVDAKGRLTAASSGAAPVILNAANSVGSSFTLDMSAASVTAGHIVPKAAGAVPVNDGVLAENTTNHTLVYGLNGTTTLVSAVAATGTGTATTCTNQVVTAVSGIAAPTCTTVANAMLANSSTTFNGQAVALGATGNVNSGAAAHSIALNQGNGSALTGMAVGTTGQIPRLTTSGDPVAFTFPDHPDYAPAANNVNGVGGVGWTCPSATPAVLLRAGTNNKGALLSPWGAADVCYVQFHIAADTDLTTVLPYLMLELTSTDATNGHTIIMQESVACAKLDGTTTDDVAFNAARSFSTITLNGNANRTWQANLQLNSTDLTGCSAPGLMWVKVSRTTDTATNVGVYGVTRQAFRLLAQQAN